MKKLLVLSMVLVSLVSYGQNKIIVGGFIGKTQSLNSNVTVTSDFHLPSMCIGCTESTKTIYKNNDNYGLWISYGKIGVLYSRSGSFGYNLEDNVSYNNPPTNTPYNRLSVDVPYENANIKTENFGVYRIFSTPIKRINYLGGVGFQTNSYHKMVPSDGGGRTMNGKFYQRWWYTLEEDNNTLPTLIGGVTIRLNDIFVLNGLAIVSHTSSFNVGVGIVID